MRSGVCGAVCRPACGAGKDPENKQPLLCESSSWSYVRVSSAVSSSDAEGERRGCSLRSGGRRVGAAEMDGRAGTARRDGGRTLACALLRQGAGLGPTAASAPGSGPPHSGGLAGGLAVLRRRP